MACEVDPAFFVEMLPDWPGPTTADGADAAWDAYVDFFRQFDRATFEYLNVVKRGELTLCDVHSELAGLSSGVPSEFRWTMVIDFDAVAQRHTRVRWFHTREEAAGWVVSQESG